jgi:hypothetical protein
MTPSCLSELKIDRMLAGELAADDAALARSHAAGCAACGGLLRHAEATARRFAEHRPPLGFAQRRGRAAVAIASAALAVMVIGLAIRTPRDAPRGVRTKGHAALGFYVSHAGQLHRGEPGDAIAPGDRLQLVTTSDAAGWIAVTGVDALAVRQVYAAPQPHPAGRDRPLPFSIIVDTTPGPTTITAVFCAEPFSIERPASDCVTDAFTVEIRTERVGPR